LQVTLLLRRTQQSDAVPARLCLPEP